MNIPLILQYINTVGVALDFIACQNTKAICRLSRKFARSKPGHGILADSVSSIIETGRDMLTMPGSRIPLFQKCEIETIATDIKQLADYVVRDGITGDTKKSVHSITDFLEWTIALYTRSMQPDDFEDTSFSYAYLSLLYHLRLFVKSLVYTVDHISVPHSVGDLRGELSAACKADKPI